MEDTWTLDEIWNKVLAGGDAKKGSITTLHLAEGKAALFQLTLVFDFQDNFLVITYTYTGLYKQRQYC